MHTRFLSYQVLFTLSLSDKATFEAQFRKKLSNTEAKLKKKVGYKKRVYCALLIRRCNREYYNNLDKKITDNKKFMKYAKPFLSGKITPKHSLKINSV